MIKSFLMKNNEKKNKSNNLLNKAFLSLIISLGCINPSYANLNETSKNTQKIDLEYKLENKSNNLISIKSNDKQILAAALVNVGDEDNNQKNPLIAAGLSFLIPGAGQIYNEEYIKGALLFAGVAGLAILDFFVIEPKAREYDKANALLPDAQKQTNSLFELAALATRVSLPALWVYNWGSAYQSSDPVYQRKLKLEQEKKEQSTQTSNIIQIRLVKINF